MVDAGHALAVQGPRQRWAERYRRFTEPASNELPRARVLFALPAALLVLAIGLIGLGLNGTSSGLLYDEVARGDDPALLAGEPQAIRSDEWFVNTAWTISQAEQGYPAVNESHPGGVDAALPFDLPRADLSIAFRPHLLGYLALDIDQATAWKWWVPGLSLIAAAYMFLVTLLPRRPGAATVIAVGFFASPFFHWWYQSSSHWPVVWALATMTAMLWAVRGTTASRWLWGGAIAYLTIVMSLGLYVPFIVPVVIVVAGFAVGLVAQTLLLRIIWRDVLRRFTPILLAGLCAAAVTAGWLASKSDTVTAFVGTVYPGARLTPTGQGGALELARLVSSSFAESLVHADGFLGLNSSEASTFLLVGIFLIPVAVGLVVHERRRGRPLPWLLIAPIGVAVLFLAFVLVPGWDAIAHVMFLDRSTPERLRIGFGLASLVLLAVTLAKLDEGRTRASRPLVGVSVAVFLLSQGAIAAAVHVVMGPQRLPHDAPLWWLSAIGAAVALYCFGRRHVRSGAVAFAAVALTSTVTVNPVYVGVLDLRSTPAAQAVMGIDDRSPGGWVGIGDAVVTALLLQSGVETYNGTQGAPSPAMWKQIDPDGHHAAVWNRLAGVSWTPGVGEPGVSNPAPDQILATFDACSTFAQRHVEYVLADAALPQSSCLRVLDRFELPQRTITAYSVTQPDVKLSRFEAPL